uniref:Methyltransferase type 11 domain-containing protein n=1 Tax=Corethron hystrix TaxID=216773 RepID=A0A7S1BZ18_9STRA|mmetsp:Transcript_7423/g.16056  ORF Transcript_7423/g.16056 Transcript_7423/m.16056 type:complete len:289 (+) Transcript_7423:124-990(+)
MLKITRRSLTKGRYSFLEVRAMNPSPQRRPTVSFPPQTSLLFAPFSSTASNAPFDRDIKKLQRENSLLTSIKYSVPDVSEYDYVRDEMACRLVDRLDDVKRHFPLALDIGSGCGHIYRAICRDDALSLEEEEKDGSNDISKADERFSGGVGGVRRLVQVDSCELVLRRDEEESESNVSTEEEQNRCATYRMVHDEELADGGKLPFPDGTFDLVISSGSLHWVNDLPGVMAEAKRVLKPDGCILLAIVGGSTLPELRSALVLAETERHGGVSPHVGPFTEVSCAHILIR